MVDGVKGLAKVHHKLYTARFPEFIRCIGGIFKNVAKSLNSCILATNELIKITHLNTYINK